MQERAIPAFRVGISGSYGGYNLGDEAILECIVRELRSLAPVDITVFSRDIEDTKRRHAVERVVAARKLIRREVVPEMKRLDLLIFGGGGLLFDKEARFFLKEVMLALEYKIPVVVYAVGVGPLEDPELRGLVAECLGQVKLITVREKSDQQILEDIGVEQEIVVTADPAFLLQPARSVPNNEIEVLEREGLPLIGISIREPGPAAPDLQEAHYHSLIANAADYMIERYNANVVFIPMERKMLDVQHSHAVISKMLRPQRALVLRHDYTSSELLALMGKLTFSLGMRLHFLIFSALQNVPCVALPYASKVEGFLEMLGLEAPPIQLVNAGRLIAHIDSSWHARTVIQEKIGCQIDDIKERARGNARMVINLLRGEPLEKPVSGPAPGALA